LWRKITFLHNSLQCSQLELVHFALVSVCLSVSLAFVRVHSFSNLFNSGLWNKLVITFQWDSGDDVDAATRVAKVFHFVRQLESWRYFIGLYSSLNFVCVLSSRVLSTPVLSFDSIPGDLMCYLDFWQLIFFFNLWQQK
jgi:hypothetical protein